MLGIILCGYLMASLTGMTWLRFGVWLLIGLEIYGRYGYRRSRLAQPAAVGSPTAPAPPVGG